MASTDQDLVITTRPLLADGDVSLAQTLALTGSAIAKPFVGPFGPDKNWRIYNTPGGSSTPLITFSMWIVLIPWDAFEAGV
jgi:hypothetical protein